MFSVHGHIWTRAACGSPQSTIPSRHIKVEHGELRREGLPSLWLGSPEEVERHGHGVLTNATSIEGIFASAGGQAFGEGDAICSQSPFVTSARISPD